ncbi:hypothetical protein [Yersinia pestis]|uniref:hypothetical protein n=1 Tax=Yersinia pestis TaxID=632 RepID=UPI00399093B6
MKPRMEYAPEFDNSYARQLSGFYTRLQPTPLKGARLLYHCQRRMKSDPLISPPTAQY